MNNDEESVLKYLINYLDVVKSKVCGHKTDGAKLTTTPKMHFSKKHPATDESVGDLKQKTV